MQDELHSVRLANFISHVRVANLPPEVVAKATGGRAHVAADAGGSIQAGVSPSALSTLRTRLTSLGPNFSFNSASLVS